MGWIGSVDSVRGARYLVNYTIASVNETRSVYLRADVLGEPAAARFPALDGLTSNLVLRAVDLQAGTLQGGAMGFSWSTWSAANPDLRLIEIKRVFTPTAGGAPTVLETVAPLPPRTSLTSLGAAYAPPVAGKAELWLQAMDTQGRRLHTRYTGQP